MHDTDQEAGICRYTLRAAVRSGFGAVLAPSRIANFVPPKVFESETGPVVERRRGDSETQYVVRNLPARISLV